jgi:hypothetical protein
LNGQPQLAAYSDPDLYREILKKQLINYGRIKIDVFLYNQLTDLEQFYDRYPNWYGSYDHITKYDGIYNQKKKITRSFSNSYISAISALGRKDIQQLLMCLNYEDILKFGLPIPAKQIHQLMHLSSWQKQSGIIASFGIKNHQIKLI